MFYEIGRSLHWERGLKLRCGGCDIQGRGRSLHWERGLKHLCCYLIQLRRVKSLPSLGAWIETFRLAVAIIEIEVAPFIGSVD